MFGRFLSSTCFLCGEYFEYDGADAAYYHCDAVMYLGRGGGAGVEGRGEGNGGRGGESGGGVKRCVKEGREGVGEGVEGCITR